jgi:hypothetical protein
MTVLAMTLPLGRNSPVHLSRRDIVTQDGDDLALNLSIIADDTPAAAAVDLSAANTTVQLLAWYAHNCWDYGAPTLWSGNTIYTAPGTITDAPGGLATVLLPRGAGDYWLPHLRVGYALRLTMGGTTRTTLCWGALHRPRVFA